MLRRRGLLLGLGALIAAPAIARTPGLLMPVKPLPPALTPWQSITWEPAPWDDFFITDPTVRITVPKGVQFVRVTLATPGRVLQTQWMTGKPGDAFTAEVGQTLQIRRNDTEIVAAEFF